MTEGRVCIKFYLYETMLAYCTCFMVFSGRLEAMLLEAKGLWAEAGQAYSSLLEENPSDQVEVELRYLFNSLDFCYVQLGLHSVFYRKEK